MKAQINDKELELIAKYLGNELTDNEKEQFVRWMDESPQNRIEVENAEKIWANSNVKEAEAFDTDLGWNKMGTRIRQGEKTFELNRRPKLTLLRVAASIIIIFGLGLLIQKMIGRNNYTEVVANNEKILSPIVLPDGSQVYLNAGSTLRYPKTFHQNTRTVELVGEAFFNVTRNEKCPFVIQTSRAKVKVLGTSFNVAAYQETDSVQVVVETGTVELSSKKDGEIIRLTHGNSGVYYPQANKLVKTETADKNTTAWKTNIILFHDAELTYVAKTLKKVFAQPITIEGDGLKKCRLNADFKNQDLEHILEAIKAALNVNVTKVSGGYVISGAGC